jgi:KaiC/GvpD/RAD55 family RecA-like ATPase
MAVRRVSEPEREPEAGGVAPAKTKLVPTGIEGLDEIIGGLPDRSVVVLAGESGSGADVFAQEILYRQAQAGSKVTYFTIERPPADIREEMALYGMDVTPLEKEGRWTFIDAYTPRHEKSAPRAGPLTVLRQELFTRLSQGKEPQWTTVDTLSYLLLGYDVKDAVDIVEILIRLTRQHGGIHFLLFNPLLHDNKATFILHHFADGVIEFRMRERTREIVRVMRIKKMRKTFYGIRVIPFSLTARGIMVETAMRIA